MEDYSNNIDYTNNYVCVYVVIKPQKYLRVSDLKWFFDILFSSNKFDF